MKPLSPGHDSITPAAVDEAHHGPDADRGSIDQTAGKEQRSKETRVLRIDHHPSGRSKNMSAVPSFDPLRRLAK